MNQTHLALLLIGAFVSLACYYAGVRHGYRQKVAKMNERSYNDGWNCRGIDDARKAREKLEARRGPCGQFKARPL